MPKAPKENVPLKRPLVVARYVRASVEETYRGAREAVLGMRDLRFRVRVLDEDAPLFLSAELTQSDAHLHLSVEVLPSGSGDAELEVRMEGSVPRTGMAALMSDPARAREAFERRVAARLRRALGRRVFTDDESLSFKRLRRAMREGRVAAEHKRERRAEIESAFAAGLIDDEERARLLKRLGE